MRMEFPPYTVVLRGKGMKDGRRTCVPPGTTGLASCPPSSSSECWPGHSHPSPSVSTMGLTWCGHRTERNQMYSLPATATAKCGQPDLCHVDRQSRNSEGRGCLSRPWGTSNNDDNSYYLLRASHGSGAVLSACHLTEPPQQSFAVGIVVISVLQRSESS